MTASPAWVVRLLYSSVMTVSRIALLAASGICEKSGIDVFGLRAGRYLVSRSSRQQQQQQQTGSEEGKNESGDSSKIATACTQLVSVHLEADSAGFLAFSDADRRTRTVGEILR